MDRASAEAHVLATKKPLLRTCSRGPGFLALSYWSDGGQAVRHALVSVDNDGGARLLTAGGQHFPSVHALALHVGAAPPPSE